LSDMRQKTNVTPLAYGLKELMALDMITFYYHYQDPKKTNKVFGVSAQQMQKVMPELVETQHGDTLHVSTTSLIFPLINAIKEIKKTIDDLWTEFKTLTAKVTGHDAAIQALKSENQHLRGEVDVLKQQVTHMLKEFPKMKQATTNVVLYTKPTCPYCLRAKALLTKKGVQFTEINVEGDDANRAEMIEKSGGGKTVPQIFIHGTHIGGSDDLRALEDEGKLDGMLKS
jgi:glutaredoxin 3